MPVAASEDTMVPSRDALRRFLADVLGRIVVGSYPVSPVGHEGPSAIGLSRHYRTGLQFRDGQRGTLTALPGSDSCRLSRR
jgi:hypothetical protein